MQTLATLAKYIPPIVRYDRYLTLYRGEMTASALENHLNELESKVDELLAVFEEHGQPFQVETAEDQETGKDHEEVKSGEQSR